MNEKRLKSLTNPIVFNAIFNKPYFAANFLNSTGLFNVKEENITVESTRFYESVDLKVADLDVVLKLFTPKLEYVNLEMQKRKPTYDMMGRLIYYLSKLICKSEPRSNTYHINKSTVVALFDFTMYEDEEYIRIFKLKDEFGNELDNANIVVIELTKLQFCNKISLKEWLLIFKDSDLENNVEKESDIMKKVKDEIRRLSDDPIFQIKLDLYEAHEEEREMELAIAKEKAAAEGRAEGLVEGKAEGLAVGKAEGLAVGKAEGLREGQYNANITNAKKMKDLNLDVNIIMSVTGLDLETINKL